MVSKFQIQALFQAKDAEQNEMRLHAEGKSFQCEECSWTHVKFSTGEKSASRHMPVGSLSFNPTQFSFLPVLNRRFSELNDNI